MAEERRDGAVEVELSLRLRTGDDDSSSAAAASATAASGPEDEAAARRNMTIFYNGRMCAVNVTELQARTIISMASQGNFGKQHQQQRQVRDDHPYHQGDSSSSSSGGGGGVSTAAAQHCVAGSSSSHSGSATPPRPPPASPRAGLQAAVAAPMMNQPAASGLSMKRSLQRFLEKRKTRAAASAAPLYARR
uniref:Protein TIFY n=1 Tax=Oryza punctata TaxID=4537 RepID=A0A0E0LH91_ORYPU